MTDLDTTLSLRKPELQVAIDRDRASDLGIPVSTIADSPARPGRRPAGHHVQGPGRAVRRLAAGRHRRTRASTEDLNQLTLPSPTAGLVKLTSVAQLKEDRGPTEIERLDRERT